MHDALIMAGWLHLVAVMTLFGSLLFPLYAGGSAGLRTLNRTWPGFTAWQHPILVGASGLALVSALVWLVLEAGEMSDRPADALNPDVIMAVLTHTRFGAIWQYHLALSAALMAAVVLLPPKRRRGLGVGDWGFAGPGLLLAALLLASLAWVGHAQMATGTEATVRLANQTVHLIAAAAWLGGLAPLARMLKQARGHPTAGPPGPVFRVLRRFSAMALTAVVLLVLSGLVNGWFLVGSVDALVSTAYGQVLMVKLALFFGLLAIAAINRLILMPRLIAATEPRSTLTALHRAVVAEQGLGLAALGVACVLGSLAPAG